MESAKNENKSKTFNLIETNKNKIKNLLIEVKSSFNLKTILLYLNEKTKLNIIKYNKKTQKLIGVNIENVKKISGKYKIKEKFGIEKVYTSDNNSLIFKGKYLNGKKNGKGKEYKEGKVIYEGDYLNGKRSGRGKEYDEEGN